MIALERIDLMKRDHKIDMYISKKINVKTVMFHAANELTKVLLCKIFVYCLVFVYNLHEIFFILVNKFKLSQ